MRTITLLFLVACASTSTPAPQPRGLEIKLATIYVDDQDKALHFYTDVLGFAKKDDVTKGGYRWLTVADPSGVELQLALVDDAAKAFAAARFAAHQPAIMFFTDDIARDAKQLEARGAKLAMPPTDVTSSTITMLDDTCGNLVQITQLHAIL